MTSTKGGPLCFLCQSASADGISSPLRAFFPVITSCHIRGKLIEVFRFYLRIIHVFGFRYSTRAEWKMAHTQLEISYMRPQAEWGMKVSHWVCAIFHSALIE